MVDYDTLKQLVEQGLSQRQIAKRLNKTHDYVVYWLGKHELKTDPKALKKFTKPIDKGKLQKFVNQGYSTLKIANELKRGLKTVRYWLGEYGLETKGQAQRRRKNQDHRCVYCSEKLRKTQKKYCSRDCQADQEFVEKLVDGNPRPNVTPASLKRWLLRQRGHQCEKCGLRTWQGEDIPLEMHHIDGDAKNNRFNNVQLICPNCHALTDTYKARNTGNGRHYRRTRYKNGKSY